MQSGPARRRCLRECPRARFGANFEELVQVKPQELTQELTQERHERADMMTSHELQVMVIPMRNDDLMRQEKN
jgi:hypothetical protein